MNDMEKVIKGLECIAQKPHNGVCGDCPYFRLFTEDPECGWCDKVAIATDALDMVRKQQMEIKSIRGARFINLKYRRRCVG